jgi:hypothetical protein
LSPQLNSAHSEDAGRIETLIALAVAATGFGASLTALYIGMRNVMGTSGAFCARGGPYVIRSECDPQQVLVVAVSAVALVLFWLLHAALAGRAGGSLLATSLLFWGALFAALGWNFIDLGFHPPQGGGTVAGWIVSGVVFWAMALGGLIPAIALGIGWLRHREEPAEPLFKEPLVRAAGAAPEPVFVGTRSLPAKKRSVWLVATAIGAMVGVPIGVLIASGLL